MVEDNIYTELWSKYNAWAMMGGALVFLMYGSSDIFLAIAFISFLIFIHSQRKVWKQFGWWGGLANLITTLRFLLIVCIVWQNAALHNYTILLLGILILIADGLDGYFARKYNTVSTFGDCYDKETDAFFVLAFGMIISQKALAGEWIIAIGLLRYLYVILLSVVENKPEVLGFSFRRQFIGMWLMGTLLACFVITPLVYIPGLMLAFALILFSFAKDLYDTLLQQREEVTH